MTHEINFTNAKKSFLTLTMPDDSKILVRTPNKKIMDSLTDLGEDFKALDAEGENADNREAVNRIYQACAEIMSNNIQRKSITVEYLEDLLDIEDLILFFQSYTDFIQALELNVKN